MANIRKDVRQSRMQARQGSHHTGNNPASWRSGPVQPHAADLQCRCRPCRLPSTVSRQRATIESYSDENGPVASRKRKEWRASFDRSMDAMPTRHPQTSYARENTCFVAERVSATKCVASCDAAVNQPVKPSPRAITGQANGKVDRTVDPALACSSSCSLSCRWQDRTLRRRRAPVGRPCLHVALHARILERQITM